MYKATIKEYRKGWGGISPVILLKDIEGLNRDHVWVKWTKKFDEFKFGDRIQFTAKEFTYISIKGEKQGLKKLRNICKI